MQVNDIVTFSPRFGESAEGIVTRVWDKPAGDPYVTVRTTEDMPRTFTRFASALVRASGPVPVRLSGCTCPQTYSWHFAGCIWGA